MRTAAKTNNRSRVERLKENLTSMKAEKVQFTEKQEQHRREFEALQRRREQVDKQLHSGGITQLPTVEERSKLLPLVCISHVCHVMCLQFRNGNKNKISVLKILTLEVFTLTYLILNSLLHLCK